MNGISGIVTFNQFAPGYPTRVTVNLKGLQGLAGQWTIRSLYGVPSAEPGVCNVVGPIYNPFLVNGTCDNSTLSVNCAVGDLGSRHNIMTGVAMVDTWFLDSNLPLFGAKSILGRTLVISTADATPEAPSASAAKTADFTVKFMVFSLQIAGW